MGNLGVGSEPLWPLPPNRHCLRHLPSRLPRSSGRAGLNHKAKQPGVGEPLDREHRWLSAYTHGPGGSLVISSGSAASEKWPHGKTERPWEYHSLHSPALPAAVDLNGKRSHVLISRPATKPFCRNFGFSKGLKNKLRINQRLSLNGKDQTCSF